MTRNADERFDAGCAASGLNYNQASTSAELTVEELFDRRIEKLRAQMKALQDVKGSLSQDFLRSGASRISALLEL